MVAPKKRRTRHSDAVDILNGINRTSPRLSRKRRQTAPRENIYDIPVSPEPPAETAPKEKDVTTSLTSPPSSDDQSAQESSGPVPDYQLAPEEDEEWNEGQEPSDDDDDEDEDEEVSETPRHNQEEEPGDPFQDHLDLFSSDVNEAASGSSEGSPSEVAGEQSSAESQPESTPEAVSAPESAQESAGESGPAPVSEVGPDDGVTVVIQAHGSGHQADGEERNVDDDSPPASQYASIPERPSAQPPRNTRSARTRADDYEQGFVIDSLSDSADSEHEREDEDQDHDLRGRPRPVEIPTVESNQSENRGNGDGIRRELRDWFSKEIDESPMETEWRKLWAQGAELRRHRSSGIPEYLEETHRLIVHVREIYEEITQSKQFSSTQETTLAVSRADIFADVRQVFEYASERTQDASVLNQFEAHMIPRMVTLIQFSFRAFTILGRPAADQFHGTLDLVLRCSVRIDDYRKTGFLPALARSRPLRLPLKRLMAALKDGRLDHHLPAQLRPTQPQPSQPLTPGITPPRVPWTPQEEEALLDGLRRYTGELYR